MRDVLVFLAGAFAAFLASLLVAFWPGITKGLHETKQRPAPPPTDWDRYDRMKNKTSHDNS